LRYAFHSTLVAASTGWPVSTSSAEILDAFPIGANAHHGRGTHVGEIEIIRASGADAKRRHASRPHFGIGLGKDGEPLEFLRVVVEDGKAGLIRLALISNTVIARHQAFGPGGIMHSQ
jgi:hypothetical protein